MEPSLPLRRRIETPKRVTFSAEAADAAENICTTSRRGSYPPMSGAVGEMVGAEGSCVDAMLTDPEAKPEKNSKKRWSKKLGSAVSKGFSKLVHRTLSSQSAQKPLPSMKVSMLTISR